MNLVAVERDAFLPRKAANGGGAPDTSGHPAVGGAMELKVWVEGIQRIVCGVTEVTTCQDVVFALAHATGKTGRFTLIERWRNNERLLAPHENPLKILMKWGEYSSDIGGRARPVGVAGGRKAIGIEHLEQQQQRAVVGGGPLERGKETRKSLNSSG
uniref:Ras-associating domain-containing protein n=1 Tax=Anopheles coluzzii TaxID=1518534 RepID=A0A8W7PLX3_ANOCL